jgi:cell division protein FtsW (lipid II flippase)
MKALLPVFCRPLGYAMIALAVFMPFIMYFMGRVTDANLVFYKECSKLLMMVGCLMIIFAYTKDETREIEQNRNRAVRNAMFITLFILFFNMVYRVYVRDLTSVDSSTFLIFLIANVLCLEYEINRIRIRNLFKRS